MDTALFLWKMLLFLFFVSTKYTQNSQFRYEDILTGKFYPQPLIKVIKYFLKNTS